MKHVWFWSIKVSLLDYSVVIPPCASPTASFASILVPQIAPVMVRYQSGDCRSVGPWGGGGIHSHISLVTLGGLSIQFLWWMHQNSGVGLCMKVFGLIRNPLWVVNNICTCECWCVGASVEKWGWVLLCSGMQKINQGVHTVIENLCICPFAWNRGWDDTYSSCSIILLWTGSFSAVRTVRRTWFIDETLKGFRREDAWLWMYIVWNGTNHTWQVYWKFEVLYWYV